MFALGVRLWTGKEMVYPSRFSVLINFDTKVTSMRTYSNDVRIDSKTYMMLTPGTAINGDIYESDIICDCENEDLIGVVEFDTELGAFVAYINNEPVYITSDMRKYEIIGNIFEDWDEFRDLVNHADKFSKIIEDTKLQNEENDKFNEAKAKKEEEKKKRDAEKAKLAEAEKVAESTEKKDEQPTQEEKSPNVDETTTKKKEVNKAFPQEFVDSCADEFDEQKDLPSKMTISSEEIRQRELAKAKALEDDYNALSEDIPDKISIEIEKPKAEVEPEPKPEVKAEPMPTSKPKRMSSNEIRVKDMMEPELEPEAEFELEPEPELELEPEIMENDEEFPDIEENDVPESFIPDEFQDSEISDFQMFPEQGDDLEESPLEPDFDFDDSDRIENIRLYVDGRGGKDVGEGAYAYILQTDDYEQTAYGYDPATTKNRMELTAVITALNALNSKCNVKIFTTSQYLIVPFVKGWISRWRENDWKKESNEEIKNKDLWEELYQLYAVQDIEWEFIKPYSNLVENLRCKDMTDEALQTKKSSN